MSKSPFYRTGVSKSPLNFIGATLLGASAPKQAKAETASASAPKTHTPDGKPRKESKKKTTSSNKRAKPSGD